MVIDLIEGSFCYPRLLVDVTVGLACVDGIISFLAFYQLMRIHLRNSLGCNRQKVFHLLIGLSNLGYFVYFALTPVAACKAWIFWLDSRGFILMAFPGILFFAAFLLLLSFWVDLCHQADDEDEEDDDHSFLEALFKKSFNRLSSSDAGSHRICSPVRLIPVGNRQKLVILITIIVFLLMMTLAVLLWIGKGNNPIDSSTVAQVYLKLFAMVILLLGGALACYGLQLRWKLRNVRSELASTEICKVVGLAATSVVCFTSSALVAISTGIPVLFHWHQLSLDEVYTSLLLIIYYFIGSSIPSAVVLWVMRDLPPLVVDNTQEESIRIAFISDTLEVAHDSEPWIISTNSENQIEGYGKESSTSGSRF